MDEIALNKMNVTNQKRYYEKLLTDLELQIVYGAGSAEILRKQIFLLEKLELYENCLHKCEEMLSKYQEEPFILGKMGLCYLKLGDTEQSLWLFQRAESMYSSEKNTFMSFFYRKIIEKISLKSRPDSSNEEKPCVEDIFF